MTDPTPQIHDETPRPELDLSNSTILLVDDNAQNLELMQAFLEELPCNIQTASDGVEAIEKIDRCIPDLLILDVVLVVATCSCSISTDCRLSPSVMCDDV